MAYWEILDIGSDYFKVGIRELEKPFVLDNYLKIVFTEENYGSSVTGSDFETSDIKFWIAPAVDAKSFTTTISGLSQNTRYQLYCYAQVNDGGVDNSYYRIPGKSNGSLYNYLYFTTLVRQLAAPDEPSLYGKRFEYSGKPNAEILLSGMTESNARYIWQVEDTSTGVVYELSLDGYRGDNEDSMVLELSEIIDAEFCTTYEMKLAVIDLSNLTNSNESATSTLTTQPAKAALSGIGVETIPGGYKHKGGAVTVYISSLSLYEFSYAQIRVIKDGKAVGIYMLEKIDGAKSSVTFDLPSVGNYTIELSVVYEIGASMLYAADSSGNTAVKNISVEYWRPDRFSWTTEPASGMSVASVPYSDWNVLCNNVLNTIYAYKGRDDITIPHDINLYGDMSGRGIFEVLSNTETTSKKGIKISSDKTLYAWRYNALNYIICCIENSDYETDVTNSDYSEHFSSGMPIYARYLTALSDKVNSIE